MTYTVLKRSDTSEYLSQFLFFMPDPPTWTKDLDEVFLFSTYTSAECNSRLILDRLGDPTNRRVGLKCAKTVLKDGRLDVSDWYPVNVIRLA